MPKYKLYKKEIEIPEGVDVEISEEFILYKVKVKGPLGEVEKTFDKFGITLKKENNKIVIFKENATRKHKRMINMMKTKITNMIIGVTKGWKCKLKIFYKHFPMNVSLEGNLVKIENFMGEKVPRYAKILPGVEVKIVKDEIIVSGVDLEAVGQTAGNIEQATKPMEKWDRRRFWDGIYIVEKKVIGNE